MIRIATIARNAEHSPNMQGKDLAILESITEELLSQGISVTPVADNRLPAGTAAVCHMSRSSGTLELLLAAEESGIKVYNSAKSVGNCSRERFMAILNDAGIPQPEYSMVEHPEQLGSLHYPAWIKRGKGWSCHKEDVCYVTNADEAAARFCKMQERGITECIHTCHIEGDIVKFYGIGKDFFRYCYPDPAKSKFGLEGINGKPNGYTFSTGRMKELAQKAAEAVGLEIYGGDCIVTAEGEIFIIDINDFPSFSAIREEAAKEIARLITAGIKR